MIITTVLIPARRLQEPFFSLSKLAVNIEPDMKFVVALIGHCDWRQHQLSGEHQRERVAERRFLNTDGNAVIVSALSPVSTQPMNVFADKRNNCQELNNGADTHIQRVD